MTDSDAIGSKAKGEKLAVDAEQDKCGHYDDKADDTNWGSGKNAPKTISTPFALGK